MRPGLRPAAIGFVTFSLSGICLWDVPRQLVGRADPACCGGNRIFTSMSAWHLQAVPQEGTHTQGA